MGAKKVLNMIKDNDVKFVDFRFTDPRGKEQHVSVPSHVVDESTFEDLRRAEAAAEDRHGGRSGALLPLRPPGAGLSLARFGSVGSQIPDMIVKVYAPLQSSVPPAPGGRPSSARTRQMRR